MVDKGVFHIYLLLNHVKNTDICDTVGLWVLKGVVVVEEGLFYFHLHPSIHTHIYIYMHTQNT